MLKKIFRVLVIVVLSLTVLYFLGPAPKRPAYSMVLPVVPDKPALLESYLDSQERSLPIKPNNQAKIIWANDSLRNITEYVIIYFHGFGTCSEEGNPVHRHIAQKFGCNLLLTRLSDHGLQTDTPMYHLTVDRLWNSALEYYAKGKKLGKKVILMSTSNGGALSLKLASEFSDIYALILYSPLLEINNKNAWLLNNHWGLHIARYFNNGDEVISNNKQEYYKKYWYPHYRLEALAQVQEFLETSMSAATFRKITRPVLLLYYYKDAVHQDSVVKVSAMLKMFDQLSTPENEKVKKAIPDAGNHVIASALRSNDIQSVEQYTSDFMENVLQIDSVK
jgi:esterase/lipase